MFNVSLIKYEANATKLMHFALLFDSAIELIHFA